MLFRSHSSNTVPSFRFPALCYPPIACKVPRWGIFTIYPTGVPCQVDNIIFLYYFMREFFTIAIFKIKADIRMNKTTLNSQKEKHSTLSLRRATRYAVNQFPVTLISIHALLAESDSYKRRSNFFNQHFYPRSPCGERPPAGKVRPWASHISIHALLAESDRLARFLDLLFALLFLSTLSLRRATWSSLSSQFLYFHFYPRSPCGERLSYFRVWA